MRIMERDLKPLSQLRAVYSPSPYIGTRKEYKPIAGVIRAQVQPVTDSLSAALYGNKVTLMRNLICPVGTDLKKDDLVEIDGEKYRITAVLTYTTHLTATAEREGKHENRGAGTGSADERV